MADAPDGADGVTLVGLVIEAASGFRRMAGPRWEHDFGFPPQSFEVLIRLARSPEGRLRMSELAARTSLTPSGLTRAVDRLCDAGLVAREACLEDRRGAFARLTPDGTTRTDEALRTHRRRLEDLLVGVLDEKERALLVAMLRRLRDQVNPGCCEAG